MFFLTYKFRFENTDVRVWKSNHYHPPDYKGRKLWNDLRKEIEREGDGGEEEVQIEIPLAILLAKMEAS